MKLNRIVLSVNNNPTYYTNLPLVYAAYKRFFPEAKISLAVVRDKNDVSLPQRLQHYCDTMSVYDIVAGVCTQNLAKLARFFEATKFTNDICMVNDVDLIPLQREYYIEKFKKRKQHELLCVGHNLYYNTPHHGKFPISYMTAEGIVFKQFMNPMDYDWKGFINSYKGFNMVDKKEDIRKPFKTFSDESLIRALLSFYKIIKQCKVDCTFKAHKDSITRKMKVDKKRLMNGGYIESHHVLPISKYKDKIILMCKYLNIDFNENWCK
jgi:hypothetical protein